MTPEAMAMTLDVLAKRIRRLALTSEEAAETLEHEASLIRQNAREELEHRAACSECRMPEPIEHLALTA